MNTEIAKRVIELAGARKAGPGGRAARRLTRDDLVRLRVWRGVGDSLSAERRQRLFSAIDAAPTARTVRADDLLIVDVAEARRQVGRRLRDLEEIEAMIVRDKGVMGGEPVFKGTRIPVHSIAAMMADGAPEGEMLEGYPKLTARMLYLSQLWSAANPQRGRPKTMEELGYKLVSRTTVPRRPDPRPYIPSATNTPR